ncbi:hypothetical protein [Microcoleus sp. FACHB-831]|uniref:hypothetical protein n=1 Tax=Microcoleus sp. FACHB-831 TaxID=2692827 RepID=UPI0018F03688|nr:hypothetical protein [Microcoleus sp. FACHB-831]
MKSGLSWVVVGVGLIAIADASVARRLEASDRAIDAATCTYKGKKLYGQVQIVDKFPDIKVKVVSAFPDLKVKQVTNFAQQCGQWQMVQNFPNLKVQIVDTFPDIQIQYVDSFPGVR